MSHEQPLRGKDCAPQASRLTCLRIPVGSAPGSRRLALHGALDCSTAPQLQRALDQLAGTRELILDLSGLTFIDSTGVRTILRCAQRNVCSLTLSEPRGQVRDVLLRLGLLNHLTVLEGDTA